MHIDDTRAVARGVNILGSTVLVRDGRPVALQVLGGVKPRQVLEVLALNAGQPVPKDRLAELVWDANPPRSYSGTLQGYVCLVRRALGLAGRTAGIATVMHGYLLDPEVVTVDLVRFRELTRRQPGEGREPADAARLARLEAAVGLATGELLASEPYSAWASRAREQFSTELAGVAGEAAECALRLDHPERAEALARVAIERDPYAEGAWRHRIEALRAAGRCPEALRVYAELRELLAEELGTCPSPATTESYLAALGTSSEVLAASPGDEVDLLLALVKRAVLSVPGVDVGTVEKGLGQVAASVAMAS